MPTETEQAKPKAMAATSHGGGKGDVADEKAEQRVDVLHELEDIATCTVAETGVFCR